MAQAFETVQHKLWNEFFASNGPCGIVTVKLMIQWMMYTEKF